MKNTLLDSRSNNLTAPKFSVVICTYNQADALKNALLSINNSKGIAAASDIELLVVINNSTDNTEEICKKFATISIVPFRYVFEIEQGLSYARNRGVEESSGELIVFTDDDVVVPDHWLSSIINLYNKEQPDCIFGKIVPDWKDHKPDWFSSTMSPAYALLDYGNEKLYIKNSNKEFFGANFSIKKNILVEAGGFNTGLGRKGEHLYIGEETQIFRYLLQHNKKIIYNPESYLYHVIHEHRKTIKFIKQYYKDIAISLAIMASIEKGRQLLGIPYYKIQEAAMFFTKLPYKYLIALLKNDVPTLFLLRLNLAFQIRFMCACLMRKKPS